MDEEILFKKRNGLDLTEDQAAEAAGGARRDKFTRESLQLTEQEKQTSPENLKKILKLERENEKLDKQIVLLEEDNKKLDAQNNRDKIAENTLRIRRLRGENITFPETSPKKTPTKKLEANISATEIFDTMGEEKTNRKEAADPDDFETLADVEQRLEDEDEVTTEVSGDKPEEKVVGESVTEKTDADMEENTRDLGYFQTKPERLSPKKQELIAGMEEVQRENSTFVPKSERRKRQPYFNEVRGSNAVTDEDFQTVNIKKMRATDEKQRNKNMEEKARIRYAKEMAYLDELEKNPPTTEETKIVTSKVQTTAEKEKASEENTRGTNAYRLKTNKLLGDLGVDESGASFEKETPWQKLKQKKSAPKQTRKVTPKINSPHNEHPDESGDDDLKNTPFIDKGAETGEEASVIHEVEIPDTRKSSFENSTFSSMSAGASVERVRKPVDKVREKLKKIDDIEKESTPPTPINISQTERPRPLQQKMTVADQRDIARSVWDTAVGSLRSIGGKIRSRFVEYWKKEKEIVLGDDEKETLTEKIATGLKTETSTVPTKEVVTKTDEALEGNKVPEDMYSFYREYSLGQGMASGIEKADFEKIIKDFETKNPEKAKELAKTFELHKATNEKIKKQEAWLLKEKDKKLPDAEVELKKWNLQADQLELVRKATNFTGTGMALHYMWSKVIKKTETMRAYEALKKDGVLSYTNTSRLLYIFPGSVRPKGFEAALFETGKNVGMFSERIRLSEDIPSLEKVREDIAREKAILSIMRTVLVEKNLSPYQNIIHLAQKNAFKAGMEKIKTNENLGELEPAFVQFEKLIASAKNNPDGAAFLEDIDIDAFYKIFEVSLERALKKEIEKTLAGKLEEGGAYKNFKKSIMPLITKGSLGRKAKPVVREFVIKTLADFREKIKDTEEMKAIIIDSFISNLPK